MLSLDHFKSGSCEFKPTGKDLCDVYVKGIAENELDASFDHGLIDALKGNSHLAVQLDVVSDSVPNNYYVDDIENNAILIGQATIVHCN